MLLLQKAERTEIPSKEYHRLIATYREPARYAIHEALDLNKLQLLIYPTGQYKEIVSLTSFVGYPIITIPVGIANNSLPYGLTIHGKRNDHFKIFKLALALQNNGPPGRAPPQFLAQ
ncbi:hypothetical protein DSO57_1015915 [Entomophthora muscae]|uniref:Uncharacterized protein n=1 Tax=Entomophthora muscae TaxID=34485 RepID=A0ACC2TRY4_9FUNG|nr:hypothetical protein DSO57_1015915 [Entomophthora muscae]